MNQTRHLHDIRRTVIASLTALALLSVVNPVFANSPSIGKEPIDAEIHSANTPNLKTWWQANGVKNTSGPIKDEEVRESPYYRIQVSTASGSANTPSGSRYDSFTYLSIPRNGTGKEGYTDQDGAEAASALGQNMSWSTFEYSRDSWVYVHLTDGSRTISSASDVRIRPSKDRFRIQLVGHNTVAIKVPFSPHGQRFSVEFAPEQMNVYNTMQGVSGSLTIRPTRGSRLIEREPQHALMIFAQPILQGLLATKFIPSPSSGTIYYPRQGKVNLSAVTAGIIYFKPGNYWMTGSSHAKLPGNVRWVYLAPGAYVKGAIQFMNDNQPFYKVTGYGILSGEQYPYESDTANNYHHIAQGKSDCYSSCVMMLRFGSSDQSQHLDLQGITVANPPYHSFVVYGNEDTFSMNVRDYQQVGAWYWQTDGIEPYSGSTVNDTFFHSNDDVLKLYHSNVSVNNTVVWKDENGPVIQWGWSPRNVSNVSVDHTEVIHNRMYWKDEKYNTCVINSSSSYLDMGATNTADTTKTYKNLTISNTNVEGMVNCALRIYALQNMENVRIDGLHIDAWNKLDIPSQYSRFSAFTDKSGKKVVIGKIQDGKGLLLHNYIIGSTPILRAGDNWASTELGRLNFDGDLWDSWDATADNQPHGKAPELHLTGIKDNETSSSRRILVSGTTSGQKLIVNVNNKQTISQTIERNRFRIAIPLPDLSNSIRIVSIAKNGVMAVQRYTIYSYGTEIGSLSDPKGDDHGPGSYVYPTDGAFSKGSFDLTGMSVYKDGRFIRFVTSVAGSITNPWGGNGMSTQRLNIYLQAPNKRGEKPGKSTIKPLLPGTNTYADGTWYRAIVADGRNDGSRFSTGVYSSSLKKISSARLTVLPEGRIIVSVSKKALEPWKIEDIGYQVSMFSSSEDTEGVGNVRPVFSIECWNGKEGCPSFIRQFRFGGGKGHVLDRSPYDSDTTDTNAIDIISGPIPQSQALSLNRSQAVVPYLRLRLIPVIPSHSTSSHHSNNSGNIRSTKPTKVSPSRIGKKRSRSTKKNLYPVKSLANTGTSFTGITVLIILLILCWVETSIRLTKRK